MLVPRDYQLDAVNATWRYFENHYGNPLILMPTGTGKSVVLALLLQAMLQAYPMTRSIVATHVETLIEQNFGKMLEAWPTAPAGVYSAGLDRREWHNQITFGGIQSIYDKAHLFGKVDIVFIDEAHLVSPKDETMYRTFLKALTLVNPKLKVVGLTATGWRLGLGHLTEGGIFTDIAIDMTTPAAWNWFVDCGYLSPLTTKKTRLHVDADGVGTSGGEFILSQLQKKVDVESITRAAVEEMVWRGQDRHMWMIFGTGVDHCVHIAEMLMEYDIEAVAIHSKRKDAGKCLEDFKAGKYRAAVSMNKLTTGVDAPGIDLIGVLRHTKSSSLWVQMLGRGTRPVHASGYNLSTVEGRLSAIAAGSKPQGCLVLDFARNTERLGPINDPVISEPKGKSKGGPKVAPVRACPICDEYSPASARVCVCCGHIFEFAVKLTDEASSAEVMTRVAQPDPIVELVDIERITYTYHKRKNSERPPALCVTYYAPGLFKSYQEYLYFDGIGGGTARAHNWWRERIPGEFKSAPVPASVNEALKLAEHLRIPKRIRVWTNIPKPRIMGYEYD